MKPTGSPCLASNNSVPCSTKPVSAWCSSACPGLEKRAARYPQFFSQIGFVHEFRALAAAEVQTLLEENWTALASGSLAEAPAPDVVAAIIRVTGGNFRLITRLLTQMERVFKINQLKHLSPAVVETARENLVIGQV
jgi:hypothetical protein